MSAAAAAAIGGKGLGDDGKFRDLDREHPELDKYKRMQKAGLPQGAIENSMMRDGILPSSLFDNPLSSPTGGAPPLVISKPVASPSTATSGPVAANASGGGGGGGESKPPPGLSLMDEMKWRQAQKKKAAPSGEVENVGGGMKIPERKKSVAQPSRMVALKPSSGPVGKGEAPKLSPALAPPLKATPKGPLPGVNPTAKYTAPVYSSVLKPTPRPSVTADKKPTPVTASFVKKESPASIKASDIPPPPTEPPKVEIDFMPAPTELLLPQQKDMETVILEDGTKVSRDKDGGFTQTNPNGVIIRQYADGATKQTNPDGTIIEVSADGSKTTQVNPDGTRFEASNGEQTACYPDGTIVKDLANGEKQQTNPDGVIIHTYTDGRKVQTSIHNKLEIISYPDGSLDQIDHESGKKIHVKPDGTIEKIA